MSTYYYLLNDTKRLRIQLDGHIKVGPIKHNLALHYAFINYMFENLGDSFRFTSDINDDRLDDLLVQGIVGSPCGDDWLSYERLDLLNYEFNDSRVAIDIVKRLNDLYNCTKYEICDGVIRCNVGAVSHDK